jgi:hypothetical protein
MLIIEIISVFARLGLVCQDWPLPVGGFGYGLAYRSLIFILKGYHNWYLPLWATTPTYYWRSWLLIIELIFQFLLG